ncbi:hypothetical protein [Azotobacter armeniacus]
MRPARLPEQVIRGSRRLEASRTTETPAPPGRAGSGRTAEPRPDRPGGRTARAQRRSGRGRLAHAEKTAQAAREAAEKANREATNARIAEQTAQARLESTAREIDGAKAVAKEAAELRRLLMVSQKGEKRSSATAAKTAKAVEE